MNGNDQENESREDDLPRNDLAAAGPEEENASEAIDGQAIDEQPFVAKLVEAEANPDVDPADIDPSGIDSSDVGSSQNESQHTEQDHQTGKSLRPGENEHPQQDLTIRVGSPFSKDPPPKRSVAVSYASGEAAYGEFGPFRYVAMGAATSTVLVLAFAGMGAWWFPFGGAVVAVLGTMLAILGLFATFRLRLMSLGCLLGHLGLFFLSYVRSLA